MKIDSESKLSQIYEDQYSSLHRCYAYDYEGLVLQTKESRKWKDYYLYEKKKGHIFTIAMYYIEEGMTRDIIFNSKENCMNQYCDFLEMYKQKGEYEKLRIETLELKIEASNFISENEIILTNPLIKEDLHTHSLLKMVIDKLYGEFTQPLESFKNRSPIKLGRHFESVRMIVKSSNAQQMRIDKIFDSIKDNVALTMALIRKSELMRASEKAAYIFGYIDIIYSSDEMIKKAKQMNLLESINKILIKIIDISIILINYDQINEERFNLIFEAVLIVKKKSKKIF